MAGELPHLVMVASLLMASLMAVLRANRCRCPAPPSAWDRCRPPHRFFTSRQGVLRSRCRRSSPVPSGLIGRNKGPSLSSPMPARLIGAGRPRGVEQDLPPLLVWLLGDVEIMLNAIGLEVTHAGPYHRGDPAAGQEKDSHQGQVANPCKVSVGIASNIEMACHWVKDGVEFFCTPGDASIVPSASLFVPPFLQRYLSAWHRGPRNKSRHIDYIIIVTIYVQLWRYAMPTITERTQSAAVLQKAIRGSSILIF